MERILHLSDFHFSCELNESAYKLDDMIKFLKIKELNISHIVFTGDVIDQKSINHKLSIITKEKNFNDNDKNDLRHKLMQNAYSIASNILKNISRELGVSPENIVITCGNHDINRLGNSINDGHSSCSYLSNSENNMKTDFSLFDEFCLNVTNRIDNFCTNIYSSGNFNFLIVNTNFVNSNQKYGKKCINCKHILNIVSEHRQKLQRTYKENKYRNIILMHAPYDSICDEARFIYDTNNQHSAIQELKSHFGLFLCGDKHTTLNENDMFFAGQPLAEEYVSYNVFEYNKDKDDFICKKLECRGAKWNIARSVESIEKIMDISYPYIKNRVFKTFGWDNSILAVSRKICHQMFSWDDFNNLFKCIVTLKKTTRGQTGDSGNTVTQSDDIFNQLTKIIINSTDSNPITFRGTTKLGKSTFLSFYYIYLLEKYLIGSLEYLPIYINFEELLIKREFISYATVKEYFAEIINRAKILESVYESPLLLIIDGVSHYKYYDEDISEALLELAEGFSKRDRFIYSIDNEANLKFAISKFGMLRTSEYLLYFDPIKLIGDYRDKYIKFINAYKAAFDEKFNIEEFNQFVTSLRLSEIDLDLVTHISELMSSSSDEINLTRVYSEYYENKIDRRMKNIAPYASFLLNYSSSILSYEQIKKKTNIDIKTFEVLKDQRYLSSFLISEYYINNVQKSMDGSQYDRDVLDTLFNKNDAQFIVDNIRQNNLKSVFINYFKQIVQSNMYKGLSSAIYVLGRISIDKKELNNLLNTVDKHLNKHKENNDIHKLNAYRSYYISRITSHPDNDSYKELYLRNLFSDEKSRELNRAFHRYYYGDVPKDNLSLSDFIGKGFDFYNTYHHLMAHIEMYVVDNKKYPLLEIELFTLCSLVQKRLQVKYVDNSSIDNYFYSRKYPGSAKELERIHNYINKYLEREISNTSSFLYDFFISFRNDLSNFLSKNKTTYNTSNMINSTMPLFTVDRLGWKIKDNMKRLTDDMIACLPEESYETVAEHILATYYIGLFYLPSKVNNQPNYDKQKVLNTILIHDIGESVSGDYPSFYERYNEIKLEEDRNNRDLFTRSTYAGVAEDLINYYDLWNNWYNSKEDINTAIAKELDKIQMLFKFYEIIKKDIGAFTNERKISFLQARRSIISPIGNQIYKIIIEENPMLKTLVGNELLTL